MKVLLYSGGVDSVCLAHLWQPDALLFIDYGGRYSAVERERLPAGTKVVQLPLGAWERPDGVLPLRNLFLVAMATLAYQTGPLTVALGSMKGDRIRDNTVPFARQAQEMLTYLWGPQWWCAGREVQVVQPVAGMMKDEVVRHYLEAGGEPATLLTTISCYQPVDGKACGDCEACANRWVALAANGIASEPDCYRYVQRHELPRMSASAVLAALERPLPPTAYHMRGV